MGRLKSPLGSGRQPWRGGSQKTGGLPLLVPSPAFLKDSLLLAALVLISYLFHFSAFAVEQVSVSWIPGDLKTGGNETVDS